MTKRIILLILLVGVIVNTQAQKGSASPYSFFGMGDENITKTIGEISRGETGVADYSSYSLFLSNPASLSQLRFTSYGLGISNRIIKVDDGTNSERSSASSLSYLALGVPIGDKAGFVFGLQPNTNVGYSLLQQITDANDLVTESNLFFGNGGTNRLFLGYGRKIHKFASFGLEGSFIFGRLSNNILNRRDSVQFATQSETNSNISGFVLKAGAQYHKPLKNKKNVEFQLGATVSLNSNLTNRGEELLFSLVNNAAGNVLPRDTILNQPFNGAIKYPLKSTVGIGIGEHYKWNMSLEYGYQGAFNFTGGPLDSNSIVNYKNASRISLGGYYLPNRNSVTSYWDRVTYRGGIKYKQSGLVVNKQDVNEYGISFGVGMPLGKSLSIFNVGLELGKRGTLKGGLIKENYFNFRIGFTLNDKWFLKRKIL